MAIGLAQPNQNQLTKVIPGNRSELFTTQRIIMTFSQLIHEKDYLIARTYQQNSRLLLQT